MDSRPLRLLSLDGGGVKGLTSLLLLKEIFRALENQGHTVQPYEYFDLIGGTSTGGLIAIMLGRLHMTIDEAIDAYKQLSPEIFKKKWWSQNLSAKYAGAELRHYWFEGKNLKDAVRQLLRDRELHPELELLESEDPSCRVFVCAASAVSTHIELLRTYKSRRIGHQNYDCFVWEAVRATSAAPLLFEPLTLQKSQATFVDGAVRANNPIDQITSEARHLWPGRSIGCLVSLGTGVRIPQGFKANKSRLHEVLQTLADIATDANNKAREFRDTSEGRELIRGKRYFRYSIPQGVGDVGLADFEKIPYMESMTLPYVVEIDDSIEDCAKTLAHPSLSISDEFNVPLSLRGIPTVNQFVARDGDFVRLEKALIPILGCDMRRKVFVLHGLGGIGKTQLAVEFARRHQRTFNGSFWLDGSTHDSIRQSIAGIATLIPKSRMSEASRNCKGVSEKLDMVIFEVLRWFSIPENNRWLLVVDNVDRAYPPADQDLNAFDIEKYFPDADHGSVLITSRLEELRQFGSSHKLKGMNENQGKRLVELRAGKALEGSEELVQELGGLPLALAQAGSYIHQTNYDVIGYLSLYRETWSTLFESNTFLSLRDLGGRSILTTWTLSYEAIQIKCPDAAQMLQLWSYFDHGDLWYGLFTPLLSVATTSETKLPEWYAQVVSSPTNFNVVIQALLSYSLAERQPTPLAYSVHPVVHQWCYHKTVRDRNATARLALIILGSTVPQQTNRNYWVVERRLLPHCNHLHKVMKDMPVASLKEYGGSNLLLYSYHMLGNLCSDQGKLKEAEEMYQRALKGYEKAWGSEHTSTLSIVNNLGLLYRDQGKLKKAEEMYQRALKGKKEAWGSEHTSTLETVNNLGNLYSDQGKLKEAEEMYQRALKGYEKAWSLEHTSTLETVNNLGNLYRDQGKLKEAEEMYQRALKGKEKAWGSEHTSTLGTVNNLGNLYRDQGKLKEAEEMYQRTLKGKEKAWGSEHTSTLETVNNLGLLYRDQGKLKEAEEMYQRALKGYEKARGSNHPNTIRIARNLENLTQNCVSSKAT